MEKIIIYGIVSIAVIFLIRKISLFFKGGSAHSCSCSSGGPCSCSGACDRAKERRAR